MIFAFLHAALGWLLAASAAWVLHGRTADVRCWAWRLGLMKGPLALLLAVPIMVVTPLPLQSLATPPTIPQISRPSVNTEESSSQRHTSETSAAEATGYGVDSESSSLRRAAPSLSKQTSILHPYLFPLAYVIGVAAVLAFRTRAARRPHRAMPRVVGVLRPHVVIPDGLTPEATAIALAHETAHVRRRDPQWSFAADLVCAAFWFAPPVWLCARAMRLESEAACDAATLQETGAAKGAYARLLLAFAGPAPALALGGPARRLARRILMLERNPKPLPRLAVAALVAVGLTVLVPWRAEARPAPQIKVDKPAPRAAMADDTHNLMEEGVRIRLEQTRAELRRLESELRELQGKRKPGFDPNGYKLIRKGVDDARLKSERARATRSLARQANRQAVRAQLDAVRQAQAEAGRSVEFARREGVQAKAQREFELRKVQQVQRDAAEAVRRAQNAAVHAIATPSAHGSRPSMEADEILMSAGKTTLKGNAKVNGETLDTVPAASKLGEPVKVVVSPDGTVWKIYRTGDKPPFEYRLERAAKAARSSVPGPTTTKKP